MRTPDRLRNQSGFTLLEIVVALLLGSIVVSAVAQFYLSQHAQLNSQMDASDVQQNLRAAMQAPRVGQRVVAERNLPKGA